MSDLPEAFNLLAERVIALDAALTASEADADRLRAAGGHDRDCLLNIEAFDLRGPCDCGWAEAAAAHDARRLDQRPARKNMTSEDALLTHMTAAELHELTAALIGRRELLTNRLANDPHGEIRWREPYNTCQSLLTAVREATLNLGCVRCLLSRHDLCERPSEGRCCCPQHYQLPEWGA